MCSAPQDRPGEPGAEGAPGRPGHRHLVRRYLLLSLLVTVAVTALLSAVAERAVGKELIAKNERLAEQAARFLWGQLQEHWVESEGASTLPWPAVDTSVDPITWVVMRFRSENNIAIVNLFNQGGEVLYSSYGPWNRRRLTLPPEWPAILAGTTHCELRASGTTFALGGDIAEPLLQTRVLVGELKVPGQSRSPVVIELYQPAEHLMEDLRRSRFWVLVAAVVCFGAMFSSHFWLFLQGQRTIVARTQELETLSSGLEEQVRERTLELATSRRLADVGRLAAGVAHEINTPIASIATCADGLLGRVQDAEVRRYLEIVRKEAFRVKAITRTLLDFSRARPASEDPARSRRVPVREALQEVVDLLAFTLSERKITVVFDITPEDLTVLAEPAALHQILLNLTTNSMDALPGGGTIRWDAQAKDDAVRIRCHDDGVGIPADILHQVMDPFVTTKDPGQGTGLGLSLAWSLARRQGGTLTIDSPGPGQGTTTTLLLPRTSG